MVSEQAMIESRINFQQSQAKLLAYGMTPQQVSKQLKGSSASAADGSFTLLSPQDGTVIHDDFIVGKMIEAGDLLFEIRMTIFTRDSSSPQDSRLERPAKQC